jgi:hypothetical protein
VWTGLSLSTAFLASLWSGPGSESGEARASWGVEDEGLSFSASIDIDSDSDSDDSEEDAGSGGTRDSSRVSCPPLLLLLSSAASLLALFSCSALATALEIVLVLVLIGEKALCIDGCILVIWMVLVWNGMLSKLAQTYRQYCNAMDAVMQLLL